MTRSAKRQQKWWALALSSQLKAALDWNVNWVERRLVAIIADLKTKDLAPGWTIALRGFHEVSRAAGPKRMERQLASLHYVLDFKCVPNFGKAQDILLTWNVRDFARLEPAIARAREDTAGAVAANARQLSKSGESESISSIITSG